MREENYTITTASAATADIIDATAIYTICVTVVEE